MRVQHCMAPVLSIVFLVASGQAASAQFAFGGESPSGGETLAVADPFAQQAAYYGNGQHQAAYSGYAPQGAYGGFAQQASYGGGSYGAPRGTPYYAPAAWGAAAGRMPPASVDPQAVFTGSMPPYTNVSSTPIGLSPPAATMGPWPTISPYENDFNQHYIEDGLWHEITRNGKKHTFSLDYLSTRTRKQRGIVGDPNAQRYLDMVRSTWDAVGGNSFFWDNQVPGGGLTGELNIFSGQFNLYNRIDLHEMADVFSDGIRARWGVENADESGFELEAWWNKDSQDIHDSRSEDSTRFTLNPIRGNGNFGIFDPTILQDGEDALIDQLVGSPFSDRFLNLRGLPLNDGTPDGVTVPYDIGFSIENRSESVGGAMDYFWTPIYRKKKLRVRPLVGVRYLFIDEEFRFTGIDSGFIYDERQPGDDDPPARDIKLQSIPNGFDDDDDGVVDNPGANAEEILAGSALFQQVAPETIAFVTMKTQTHLFGPEIGFRYSLGGDKVKIWGQSKFALLANREELKLRGDNIGMITRRNGQTVRFGADLDEFTEGEQALFEPSPGNPNPNAFDETDDHTHISPLLEQGFYMNAQLLSFVPVINKMKVFEAAKFQMGWTIIYVADIAQTNESIVWDGQPMRGLFPHIEVRHRHWWTSNYSFGVLWEY